MNLEPNLRLGNDASLTLMEVEAKSLTRPDRCYTADAVKDSVGLEAQSAVSEELVISTRAALMALLGDCLRTHW